MSRVRFITTLCCAATFALLCLPAGAFAGTFTYNMPGDFSTSGANPDHDKYGGTPWSYLESAPGVLARSHDPSTFARLSSLSSSVDGGLVGWSDPTDPATLVGTNPTNAPITNGGDTFAPGQLVMTPAADRFVAVGWTSPLPQAATVAISGQVTADGTGICVSQPVWRLEQNGVPLATASAVAGTISASAMVPPGGAIYLTLDSAGLPNAACDTAGVTLQISVSQVVAPKVALTSPAPGALIGGGQPMFAGSISGYGAGNQSQVRVYRGSSASGTPVETLTANRSGNGYSIGPNPALADGLYTAQAELDSLSSPPDAGFSSPVTFTVHNATPTIKLNSLGSTPLHTSTPTFTGTAGTDPGDSSSVVLLIYPGGDTRGTPMRFLAAGVGAGGHYSVHVAPGLDDGRYTAVAGQPSAGPDGTSPPVTFRIKVHAPVVTLNRPDSGAHTSDSRPLLSGLAGTSLGDSNRIGVALYAGTSTRGRALGTISATAHGSQWSVRWPHALRLGLYTARASQSDDAGHTALSKPHTFLIVPAPQVIGSAVTLDRSGSASVSISCTAPSGQTCTGTVLILTSRNFQTVPGGPAGQLRVMFAYVTIPGGQTQVVTRGVPTEVTQVLRRNAPLAVQVTANLSPSGGPTTTSAATRVLRLA